MHDQVEAMTLADKIALHTGADVAKKGSLAHVGTPTEVQTNLSLFDFISIWLGKI